MKNFKSLIVSLMLVGLSGSVSAADQDSRARTLDTIEQLKAEVEGYESKGVFKKQYYKGRRTGCSVKIYESVVSGACFGLVKNDSRTDAPNRGVSACNLRSTEEPHLYEGDISDWDLGPEDVRFVRYDDLVEITVYNGHSTTRTCIFENL